MFSLSVQILAFKFLEMLYWIFKHFIAMWQRSPLYTLNKFLSIFVNFLFISNHSQVYINVIITQWAYWCLSYMLHRYWTYNFLIIEWWSRCISFIHSLRSLCIQEMIFTLQSRIPFNWIFQLKLQFRVSWAEFKWDFIYQFWGQSIMWPSLQ